MKTRVLMTAGAVAVLALSGTSQARTGTAHSHRVATATTVKQAVFHDDMRKLWEDHVTWTRLAIVSFAGELPDLPATQARLLRNQADIGNAVRPYYGRAAAEQLTVLLKTHIAGAVALLQAAKAGDPTLIGQRRAEWYANGNDIADFLNRANPHHWPRRALRRMMKTHLDQTLDEATHRLQGDYEADIRDYERIHEHILEMADMLSTGIIKQFPRRFR